jgi:hypothetical protein
MIIVRLNGGLGNQLFQYALGRSLAERRRTVLKLDTTLVDADPKRRYSLGAWNVRAARVTAFDRRWFRLYWAVRRRVFRHEPYYRGAFINEQAFLYDANILRAPRMCSLNGYWQSEKYFADIEPLIRRELTLREELSAASREVARNLRASNSVFLHIRRGDAVHDPRGAAFHGTPSPEYYDRAAAYIGTRVADPHFFLFSDEPQWVKQNLHLSYPMTVIDHNPPSDALAPGREHEDLWLMSLCRHAILANSSFSWWGAWLNPERERIVIAPKQWLRSAPFDTCDLIPGNWIKM